MVKVSCDFISGNFSYQHPVHSNGHSECDNGDIMFPVSLLILQDHIIKESCGFMGGNQLW